MITSYNQRKNNPVYEHHHPLYHYLDIVPNSEIMACTKMSCENVDEKAFLDPKTDESARKNKSN